MSSRGSQSWIGEAVQQLSGASVIDVTRPADDDVGGGWNYRDGAEDGTLFLAYTNNLSRFETLQRRVIGDALSRYTLTVGGGYFFVPPPKWIADV